MFFHVNYVWSQRNKLIGLINIDGFQCSKTKVTIISVIFEEQIVVGIQFAESEVERQGMRGVQEGRSEVLVDNRAWSHHLLKLNVFEVGRVDSFHKFYFFGLKLKAEIIVFWMTFHNW